MSDRKFKRNPALGRRTFLQALGLTAGSLALPRFQRPAWADEDGTPMRLLVVFTEHGTHYPDWKMTPPGQTPGENDQWEMDLNPLTEAEFSPILRPFHKYRDRMMVLDGTALIAAMADPYGDGHAKGWTASLTGDIGSKTVGVKAIANSPSIDQMIVEHLRETVPNATDLMGLNFSVGVGEYPFHHFVWRRNEKGGVDKVPHVTRADRAFDLLFPTPAEPGSVGAERLSVLDQTKAEFDSVAQKLDGPDRARMELHRDLIRDLENRITYLDGLTCGEPTLPTIPDRNTDEAGWFMELSRAYAQVIGAGFACGTTRVANVLTRKTPFAISGGSGDYHHDYAHQLNMEVPEIIQVVRNTEIGHADQIVAMADILDQIDDVDGNSVLDNTCILWVSELAAGWHSHSPWPVVMLGGAANKFRMGRYIRYPQVVPRPLSDPGATWAKDFVGQPHNHMLVSICQAMGLDVNHVGLESVTGYLPEGGTVQLGLTGRLEEMF